MNLTRSLKSELWKRFGSKDHPAEWDGHVFGGGKLSQRFWEYFKAIELLDLDENAVVLDLGGICPATGTCFFAMLLAPHVQRVIVMDPNAATAPAPPGNVEFIRAAAAYDTLRELLETRSDLTHLTCLSVFEHIEPAVREGITRAINDHFRGSCFVATFEYHAKKRFTQYQLTTRTVSDLFQPLTNFYLDQFAASPVWCENAFDTPFVIRPHRPPVGQALIPQWYPVAVRFLRA